MNVIKKIFNSRILPLSRLLDWVSQGMLCIMMLMTVADVLLRKFSNRSVTGALEITELLMVLIVFGALARCEINDGHIRIDFVLKRFSPRIRIGIDAATQFLCFLFFTAMSWAAIRHAATMKMWGEVTLDLQLPVYPFVYAASIGCGLMALVLLFKSILAFGEALKK